MRIRLPRPIRTHEESWLPVARGSLGQLLLLEQALFRTLTLAVTSQNRRSNRIAPFAFVVFRIKTNPGRWLKDRLLVPPRRWSLVIKVVSRIKTDLLVLSRSLSSPRKGDVPNNVELWTTLLVGNRLELLPRNSN